jgi:hypothetical protein
MAIETKLATFKEKYSLPEEAITELKAIFDSIIVEFTHKIINTESVKTVPKLDTSRVIYTEKRFATKIADEYASECNVTLEEIPSETGKVTKKDVEKYVKTKTGLKSKKSKNPKDLPEQESKSKSKSESESKLKITSKTDIETDTETKETKKIRSKTDFESEAETDTEIKKIVSKKEKSVTKEKCNGITKDGNPCNLNATKNPDGSKKCYCFRHAIDWKQYEVSSDSDYEKDESEEKLVHENKKIVHENKKMVHEDLDIVESD